VPKTDFRTPAEKRFDSAILEIEQDILKGNDIVACNKLKKLREEFCFQKAVSSKLTDDEDTIRTAINMDICEQVLDKMADIGCI
jgi:hypothetical protein